MSVLRSTSLLALAASALAGQVFVTNKSPSDIHLWSVTSSGGQGPLQVVKANGGTYVETYQTPAIGGVSIKLGPASLSNPDVDGITQLEYTFVPAVGTIWWDLSNINGNPFTSSNVEITPTNPSGCTVPSVLCAANTPLCGTSPGQTLVYQHPDDKASQSCPGSSDLQMTIYDVSQPAQQAPPVSSPAPSPKPSPTQVKAPPPAPTTTLVKAPSSAPAPPPAPAATSPTPVPAAAFLQVAPSAAPAPAPAPAASPAPNWFFGLVSESFFEHGAPAKRDIHGLPKRHTHAHGRRHQRSSRLFRDSE